MNEYLEQTIPRIQGGLTFQQWMDGLSNSQLESFSNKEDDETGMAIVTLAAYFAVQETARDTFEEDELEDFAQRMAISLACESNVREGSMVRLGEATVVDSTAKYQITPAGKNKVKNMIKNMIKDSEQ